MKQCDWTECYRLPLHLDDYCSYAWDVDGNMALSSFDLVYVAPKKEEVKDEDNW